MPLTRDQAIEYTRRALAEGISTERIRQVLQSRGIGTPDPSSELQFDPGTGQSTGPVQRQPPDFAGLNVEEQRPPKFGERVMMGAVRAAPVVAGSYLGGEALGGSGLLGLIGRGLGAGVGNMTSDLMSGERPSFENAGMTAGANMATEGAFNLAGRVLALPTSVEQGAVGRALQKPTTEAASTVFSEPPAMAERRYGLDLASRVKGAKGALSEGRLTKLEILKTAQSSGVKVPLDNVYKAIDGGIQEAGGAVGKENSIAVRRLTKLKSDLEDLFPDGQLTPSQADAQLRAFQRDAIAAGKTNPFLKSTYRGLQDSMRESFHTAVESAAPGSDLAAATGQARKYLNAVDALKPEVSNRRPEEFIRGLFTRSGQSKLQALRDFEEQTGTGGSLEARARTLADKRTWTDADQERAFGIVRTLYSKLLGKPLVKGAVVASRPAGTAAGAAVSAFNRAFSQENNP
jgi:hypothetical protein